MRSEIKKCVLTKHIDSFQKLRVLLFLYKHPKVLESTQSLARRLYVGDVKLMEEIIGGLRQAGFLKDTDDYCVLDDSPAVKESLRCLSEIFEKPLPRQRLLREISVNARLNRQADASAFDLECSQCPLHAKLNNGKASGPGV